MSPSASSSALGLVSEYFAARCAIRDSKTLTLSSVPAFLHTNSASRALGIRSKSSAQDRSANEPIPSGGANPLRTQLNDMLPSGSILSVRREMPSGEQRHAVGLHAKRNRDDTRRRV